MLLIKVIFRTFANPPQKKHPKEKLGNPIEVSAIGKSHVATELNRAISKVRLLLHSHYSEILKRTGKVTAVKQRYILKILRNQKNNKNFIFL